MEILQKIDFKKGITYNILYYKKCALFISWALWQTRGPLKWPSSSAEELALADSAFGTATVLMEAAEDLLVAKTVHAELAE